MGILDSAGYNQRRPRSSTEEEEEKKEEDEEMEEALAGQQDTGAQMMSALMNDLQLQHEGEVEELKQQHCEELFVEEAIGYLHGAQAERTAQGAGAAAGNVGAKRPRFTQVGNLWVKN